MKLSTVPLIVRNKERNAMSFRLGFTMGLVFGILSVLMLACSASYTISSPECPPDDSLSTARHPLGCGIYMPPDTSK